MSLPSINSTAVRDLAATIHRQLDADRDGKLSSAEFEGFLSQFLNALQNHTSASTAPATQSLFSLGAAAGAGAGAGAAAANRHKVGYMGGFDLSKLANVNHNTFKYEVGRIVQYFPNTPAGLRDALPEIQQLVPGAKIVGSKGDKVDFGSYVDNRGERIGIIDLIQAAGHGGVSWQWLTEE